jgi:K(+)-stimulated pyrophosphate-energized sodium pump
VGDTVGDPFKDTSSVALNPIIKFTTLFGLLAVELAVTIPAEYQWVRYLFSIVCFVTSTVFVYRSFYGMRIVTNEGAMADNDRKRAAERQKQAA